SPHRRRAFHRQRCRTPPDRRTGSRSAGPCSRRLRLLPECPSCSESRSRKIVSARRAGERCHRFKRAPLRAVVRPFGVRGPSAAGLAGRPSLSPQGRRAGRRCSADRCSARLRSGAVPLRLRRRSRLEFARAAPDEVSSANCTSATMSVVGIDLGTTNSVIATVRDNQVVVVPAAHGGYLPPSVVSFSNDGLKYFSREAVARRIVDPKYTVFSAKRLIGLPFRSKEVQRAIARLPYELREGNNEQAVFVAPDRVYTVPEVSGLLLGYLRQCAELFLG